MKTMKVSEIIEMLTKFKNTIGDVPVFHQSDPEGNSFGTIQERSFSWDDSTKVGKAIFLCPFEEGIEDE